MNTKRHSLQRGILHLSFAIVIAGLISIGTFFIGTFNGLIHPSATGEVSTQTQTATPAVRAPKPAASSAASDSKDCGTDIGCFIAQVSTCGPASVEFSGTINLAGAVNVTASSNLAIGKTKTANSCSFTARTDAVKATHMDGSLSEDQFTAAVGTKESCTVPSDKLAAILTNWKAGSFNADDLTPYACSTATPSGASFAATQSAQAGALIVHGQTFPYTNLQIGTQAGASNYKLQITSISKASVMISFMNTQTNQNAVVTAKLNARTLVPGYAITVSSIDQNGGRVSLQVQDLD